MQDNTNCENCIYYDYDEEYECFVCMMNLDEDEMFRFISGTNKNCPYYKYGDDYTIVRKQN